MNALKIFHVSPSQIKLARTCEAKYVGRYNDKLPDDSDHTKQDFGKAVHGSIQHWLTAYKPLPKNIVGDTARLLVKPGFLPTPSSRLIVEKRFSMVLPEAPGIALVGQADCLDPLDVELGIPVVDDVKTTTDKKWMITKAELPNDPQGVMYTKYLSRLTGSDFIMGRWLTAIAPNVKGIRKAKIGLKTEHIYEMTSADYLAQWDRLIKDALKINEIRRSGMTIKDATPAGGAACETYGGCPFRGKCSLTRARVMLSYYKRFEKVSDLDIKVQVTTPPLSGTENEVKLSERIKARQANIEQPDDEDEEETPKTKKSKRVEPDDDDDAGDDDDDSMEALEAKLKAKKKAAKEAAAKGETDKAADRFVERAASTKKSAKAPINPPEGDDDDDGDTEEEAPAKKTKSDKSAKANKLSVFYDVGIVRGSSMMVKTLSEVLAPIAKLICEEHSVPHWSHVEFGKGAGLLSAGLESLIDDGDVDDMIVVASSSTPEGAAVRDMLTRRASVVLQGQR